MNDSSILITRPNHDRPTNYLFYWSKPVIKTAEDRGFSILDLKGKKANKKALTSYFKRHKPKIVFFNGHGNIDVITGIDNQILIKANDNDDLLADKIIYARSCKSAKMLGENCVRNKKVIAYIGYINDFILLNDSEKVTKPLKDKIASYFLEPSNLVVKTLIKGNSPKEAYDRSQKESIRKIKHLLSPKTSKEEKSLVPYLWRNMKAQVLIN
ncbi:MAG: hypothetical protein ABFQ62_04675 [Patescibacteria group bacterium]